jgi:RND family efflux transporter MFP subunit
MSKRKTIILSLAILLTGALITLIIFLTEPKAVREGATKKTAMLVQVLKAEKGNYRPEFITTGVVEASKDIVLSPRVTGQVTTVAEGFVPGGYVRKGEVLLRLDPSDYENAVELQKSDLSQALADLKLEEGRQDVAKQDLKALGDTLRLKDQSLVLREPQLRSARSRVDGVRASLRQAELELQRTVIRAPFDAHILERQINEGSMVHAGDYIARLTGTDIYWVIATVKMEHLRWLSFPEQGNQPSEMRVKVRNRSAWQNGEYRYGFVNKLIGALDEQTRLARILISIPDPLALHSDSAHVPKMMIDEFMEVTMHGNPIEDVIRINRDYIRKNEAIWIMDSNKLQIKKPEIILKDARYAYVSEGINEGDKIVITNLSTVTEGAALRVEPDTMPESANSKNNIQ